MPTGTTLSCLVDEFATTLYQHGIVVGRETVEQEMRDRIADIAEYLRVDPETVLRDHASPNWGRMMAADVVDQIQKERLLEEAGATGDLPVAG